MSSSYHNDPPYCVITTNIKDKGKRRNNTTGQSDYRKYHWYNNCVDWKQERKKEWNTLSTDCVDSMNMFKNIPDISHMNNMQRKVPPHISLGLRILIVS